MISADFVMVASATVACSFDGALHSWSDGAHEKNEQARNSHVKNRRPLEGPEPVTVRSTARVESGHSQSGARCLSLNSSAHSNVEHVALRRAHAK